MKTHTTYFTKYQRERMSFNFPTSYDLDTIHYRFFGVRPPEMPFDPVTSMSQNYLLLIAYSPISKASPYSNF